MNHKYPVVYKDNKNNYILLISENGIRVNDDIFYKTIDINNKRINYFTKEFLENKLYKLDNIETISFFEYGIQLGDAFIPKTKEYAIKYMGTKNICVHYIESIEEMYGHICLFDTWDNGQCYIPIQHCFKGDCGASTKKKEFKKLEYGWWKKIKV